MTYRQLSPIFSHIIFFSIGSQSFRLYGYPITVDYIRIEMFFRQEHFCFLRQKTMIRSLCINKWIKKDNHYNFS
jgi:hypothetical protein